MKKINFEKLEILSPAGNTESFMAALNNGADAIYLGLDKFNARMKADNFTKENIREYIKLAHSFNAKVYITINTLLNDEDFDELIDLVCALIQAKADAFIVQDLGVAHILKTCFDGITLHASTQMGIHNLEGALVAQKLGFSRIVLSRETSLEDIKEIHEKTNLEIEYFVQGALCVAFSGNCYLSSLEHGLSGNEGKCLQLCRLPYTNSITNETKYFLSPRDLALIKNLPVLIEAGVTSFKIEGRLKHSGYVSLCTNLYKNALNLIKNNNFNIKFINQAYNELQKSFSRGEFNKSAYLIKNNENNIINSTFQNHIGIKIGTITKVKPFKQNLFEITMKLSHKLTSGDGLKFIDTNNKQIDSVGVGNVEVLDSNNYKIITNHNLKIGLDVYLIQDSILEQKYLKNKRKVALNLTISAKICEKLKVKILYNHHEFIYESNEILQPAQSSPLSEEDIITQFNKASDTIFEIQKIEAYTNGIFAPKSLLNKWRREMFSTLEEHIIFENEKHINATFLQDKFISQKAQNVNILPQNISIIDDNYDNFNKNQTFIFSPDDYSKCLLDKNYKLVLQNTSGLSLPVITKFEDKKIINSIINNLTENHMLFINNIGGLYYKIFNGREIVVSPLLNIKNKFAIQALNDLGVTKICASIEASKDFINKYNLSGFSDGEFPLMTFAHCPYKAVHDNSCTSCKHTGTLTYKNNRKQEYKIKRVKISNCYFYLMKNLKNANYNYLLKNFKSNPN